MGSWEELAVYKGVTAGINNTALGLENDALNFKNAAGRYETMANEAEIAAANANAAADSIERKLLNLETWFSSEFAIQRGVIETKAQRITERLDRARDPRTGRRIPIDEVSASLFELHRSNPLTAHEHDNLLIMNVGQFDAHPITAGEYDVNGRELLA